MAMDRITPQMLELLAMQRLDLFFEQIGILE